MSERSAFAIAAAIALWAICHFLTHVHVAIALGSNFVWVVNTVTGEVCETTSVGEECSRDKK